MMMRDAVAGDVPAIARLERNPEFRGFISAWTEDKHARTMADKANAYIVAEDDVPMLTGFVILVDVHSEHRSVELRRIVVATPGLGHGRALLKFAAARVFDEYRAHRLWLDVFESNTRARHVYGSFGFHADGILREAVYRDGIFHSLALMSLLDREYRVGQRGGA